MLEEVFHCGQFNIQNIFIQLIFSTWIEDSRWLYNPRGSAKENIRCGDNQFGWQFLWRKSRLHKL